MREATEQEWQDYIAVIKHQMSLIDRLSPENRRVVHEIGYDAVMVRRMLAEQRRKQQH
jgi:hypothetical protein